MHQRSERRSGGGAHSRWQRQHAEASPDPPKARPLTPRARARSATERVRQCLRRGDEVGAHKALEDAIALAMATEPPIIPEEELLELRHMVDTLPTAALQVFRHMPASPFSALGVDKFADARILNQVNRRTLLKKYRKLALELHPDRCDHAMAVDAMQALNAAYDKIMPKPVSTGGASPPHQRAPPARRRPRGA